MPSPADQARFAFDDLSRWEIHREVNVFDEHVEHRRVRVDDEGRPCKDGRAAKDVVVTFDRAKLERLAAANNARDAAGQPCPLMLGHTVDGAPETAQPPIVGYARAFKVVWDDALKRHVIRATYYVRRDRAAEAAEYPRTSPEVWGVLTEGPLFDPISLLKRTPQRDLGQWTYGARGYVLRYSMAEAVGTGDPATPTPGMGDGGLEAAVMAILEKLLGPGGKYAACGAASGAASALPAAVTPPGEPERMQKAQADIQAAHYARQLQEEQAARQQLQATVTDLQRRERVSRYERDLSQLLHAGYDLVLAEEVAAVAEVDQAGFDRHKARIVARYRKAPIGPAVPTLAGPATPLPETTAAEEADAFTPRHLEVATTYMRLHVGCDWEAAEKYAREKLAPK